MPVVVGVTAGPEGQAAFERAVEEAHLRRAHLHIVRALGSGLSENPARAGAWADEVRRAVEVGAGVVADLRESGVAASYRVESVGLDPAAVLLNVAREVRAELIVIGLRPRSPVGKLVLGSVSQDLLLGADCAVLVVKAPGRS
jgi:nucleotide-binding universal stress UspA family protein